MIPRRSARCSTAGAKANARETERGHTALMFAAAANRLPAVKLLLARGADPAIATKLTDLSALSRDGSNPEGRTLANTSAGASTTTAPARRPAANAPRPRVAGLDRQYFFNELVHAQGGMAPLHFAVRQGYSDVALALIDAGVDVNQLKGGDLASPLLIATVNGHFDLGVHAARSRRQPESRRPRTASPRSTPCSTSAGRRKPAIRSPGRTSIRRPATSPT